MKHFYKFIATLFYIGYFPVAPGTLGSLMALVFYFLVKGDPLVTAIVIAVCFFLGVWTGGKAENILGGKDASKIIIDEFTGMLLALYLLPVFAGYAITAFLLFRFFDVLKPVGIRRLEKLKGGWGIMLDDLLAGVYANLILQIIRLNLLMLTSPHGQG